MHKQPLGYSPGDVALRGRQSTSYRRLAQKSAMRAQARLSTASDVAVDILLCGLIAKAAPCTTTTKASFSKAVAKSVSVSICLPALVVLPMQPEISGNT